MKIFHINNLLNKSNSLNLQENTKYMKLNIRKSKQQIYCNISFVFLYELLYLTLNFIFQFRGLSLVSTKIFKINKGKIDFME